MGIKVSVVMSVYNGEKYLCEAIESILNQTFTYFEFIIIDDGSSDRSANIVKSYIDSRIVFIQQKNSGLATALNRGIKIAKGKYIARMDADDRSHPERLLRQVAFMNNNPSCVVLGTQAVVMTEEEEELYSTKLPADNESIKAFLPLRNPFYHGAVMFNKNVFQKAGGYSEDAIHFIEDSLLWNRLSAFGEMYNLKESYFYYRLIPDSLSNRVRKVDRYLSKVILKASTTHSISEADKQRLRLLNDKMKKKGSRARRASYNLVIGRIYFERRNEIGKARNYFMQSIKNAPLSWQYWFYLGLTFIPFGLGRKWRRRRMGLE